MSTTPAACPRCSRPMDHAALASGEHRCVLCGGSFEATRFDPPPPDASISRMAETGPEGAQACPAHPANAAVVNCGRCGVFACALCRIEVDGRILCPACFERLGEAGELPGLVRGYRDYLRAQSLLVLLGILIIFIGVVTGPASLYCGARALRQKRERGDTRGQIWVWVLLVLGVLELAASVALYASMLGRPGG